MTDAAFVLTTPEGVAVAQAELTSTKLGGPSRARAMEIATEALVVLDNELRCTADNYKEAMRLQAALDHRDEMLLTLIRLAFTPAAQANIERFARRLARREPPLAERIHALLPPMNPLRADDELASPERRDPEGGLSEDNEKLLAKVATWRTERRGDDPVIVDDYGSVPAMLVIDCIAGLIVLVRRLSAPASSATLSDKYLSLDMRILQQWRDTIGDVSDEHLRRRFKVLLRMHEKVLRDVESAESPSRREPPSEGGISDQERARFERIVRELWTSVPEIKWVYELMQRLAVPPSALGHKE